jgi:hypothetical protein
MPRIEGSFLERAASVAQLASWLPSLTSMISCGSPKRSSVCVSLAISSGSVSALLYTGITTEIPRGSSEGALTEAAVGGPASNRISASDACVRAVICNVHRESLHVLTSVLEWMLPPWR